MSTTSRDAESRTCDRLHRTDLTASELAALKRMAEHEGYLPHLGQPELEGLARSNQQLLASGRNLNQIAKA